MHSFPHSLVFRGKKFILIRDKQKIGLSRVFFFLIFQLLLLLFFLLYNIVLVLPYINMVPPWVYTSFLDGDHLNCLLGLEF